jgi:hypothetical protein
VITGVIIDAKTTELLLKENINFKLVKAFKKVVPVLYIIGAVSLII